MPDSERAGPLPGNRPDTTLTTSVRHRDVSGAIPDGQRCINCKVPARHGAIVHAKGCPEYGRISGTLTATVPPRQRGSGMPAEPPTAARVRYERFVALLGRPGRRDRYTCPSCGAAADGHGLKVDFDGQTIRFWCFSCRGRDEILAALGCTWDWIYGESRAGAR